MRLGRAVLDVRRLLAASLLSECSARSASAFRRAEVAAEDFINASSICSCLRVAAALILDALNVAVRLSDGYLFVFLPEETGLPEDTLLPEGFNGLEPIPPL